jgi:hypothetical protein
MIYAHVSRDLALSQSCRGNHLDEKSAMLRLAPSRHVRGHRGRERLTLDLNRSQR